MDELAKLKVERLEIETHLQNEKDPLPDQPDGTPQISCSEACVMAKAQIYSAALERGEYVSESMIEEQVQELAAEIMRVPSR